MVTHTLAYWWQRWSPGQPTWRDLVAGLSVAGLLLPEAVAYAGIGNMPPQAGVMALFVGLLCYGLLGSSRFAIVSATSSSAAVLFAATGSLAGADLTLRFAMASGLVLLTGVLFLVGAAARVGGVSAFIAKPVLRGFTFGLALVIILKQGPKLVGLHIQAPDLQHLLPELLRQIDHWHLPSLAVGSSALVLMLLLGRLKQHVPVALVVMVLGIVLQRWGPLAEWDVIRVGDIQVNLELYAVPELTRIQWLRLGELAVAMVLILYAESYGSIRTLALRHGDRNEPNRDLLALGVSNVFSSLLHGMPVGAGYSASVANEASGAKTKWSGLFAAGVLLIVVLTLLPFIEDLPEPVLAAIVVLFTGTRHELAPTEDQGAVIVVTKAPQYAGVGYTAHNAQPIEKLFESIPEFDSSFMIIGDYAGGQNKMIGGAILIAFPLYVAFVASTHSLEAIMQVPMPLWPGASLIENYSAVLGDNGLGRGMAEMHLAAQGFGRNIAIGHLPCHQLKAANHAAKLLALADVIHGAFQLLCGHAHLQRGQAGNGVLLGPGRGGCGQHMVGRQRQGIESQIGQGLMVLAETFGFLDAGLRQVHHHHARFALCVGGQQGIAGHAAQRHSGGHTAQRPATSGRRQLQGGATGARQGVE